MSEPTSRRVFLQHLAFGAGLAAVGGRAVRGGAGAGALAYTNPVYAGSMPDPGVLRTRGAYYAVGTTGTGRLADGRVFTLLRSLDLVRWEALGGALTPPSADAGYDYWAPELAEAGGRFYLYYAMGHPSEERMAVHAAVSDRPEGPYTDSGAPLLECEGNRFAIDPHPFRDVDGQWYLFYARNYPEAGGGYLAGTGLAVDRLVGMTRLAGECRMVIRPRYPWTLYQANRRMDAYDRTFAEWHTIEAPFVRRHAGTYYCFYSGANWQTDRYGVDYAVADRVTGPYTGQGREARVLRGVPGRVRGPGHHSIVEGPDGRDWVVYHAWDPGMRVRQLCIDPLVWTPDGPRCTPTAPPQRVG